MKFNYVNYAHGAEGMLAMAVALCCTLPLQCAVMGVTPLLLAGNTCSCVIAGLATSAPQCVTDTVHLCTIIQVCRQKWPQVDKCYPLAQ